MTSTPDLVDELVLLQKITENVGWQSLYGSLYDELGFRV